MRWWRKVFGGGRLGNGPEKNETMNSEASSKDATILNIHADEENLYLLGPKFETAIQAFMGHLQKEESGIRIEARRLLARSPKALARLSEIYRDTTDPRVASAIGRVFGSIYSEPLVPADVCNTMYGLPIALIECNCPHCEKPNKGIAAPPRGDVVPCYGQKENKGKTVTPVLCDSCGHEFFVGWDETLRVEETTAAPASFKFHPGKVGGRLVLYFNHETYEINTNAGWETLKPFHLMLGIDAQMVKQYGITVPSELVALLWAWQEQRLLEGTQRGSTEIATAGPLKTGSGTPTNVEPGQLELLQISPSTVPETTNLVFREAPSPIHTATNMANPTHFLGEATSMLLYESHSKPKVDAQSKLSKALIERTSLPINIIVLRSTQPGTQYEWLVIRSGSRDAQIRLEQFGKGSEFVAIFEKLFPGQQCSILWADYSSANWCSPGNEITAEGHARFGRDMSDLQTGKYRLEVIVNDTEIQ
jgi:hypothetical protein